MQEARPRSWQAAMPWKMPLSSGSSWPGTRQRISTSYGRRCGSRSSHRPGKGHRPRRGLVRPVRSRPGRTQLKGLEVLQLLEEEKYFLT